MNKIYKFKVKVERKIVKALGLDIYKQEAMLRVALKEKGLDYKKLNIEVDHLNGVNIVNGVRLPVIYPDSYFTKAEKLLQKDKSTRIYFNGNMSVSGQRVQMLEPFRKIGAKIIESDFGRSPFNKNKFNTNYYKELASAEFGLCPHQKDWTGPKNTMWTYRFIECCQTLTIPVVFDETPLGASFTSGFHFVSDGDLLNDRASYDRKYAEINLKLCRERFSLVDSLVEQIKIAKADSND